MQRHTHRVSGEETLIFFPETDADLSGFTAFIDRTPRVIGLDTETTGLDVFGASFACRLVQFGDEREAWVLRADQFAAAIRSTLARADLRFVVHNAPFDLTVLHQTGLASMADLGPRVFDTYILGHLLDPRTEHEGGTGLGLKALSAIYVDAAAPDTAAGLYEVFRREYKATKHTGWALINIDHPLYVTYAGLDVILVTRLLRELGTLIRETNLSRLATWEHEVQLLTTRMTLRGLRVDVDYTTQLAADLEEERERYAEVAAQYGVENVQAPRQVAAALTGMGETWPDRTDTGAPSVGKDVLLRMADLDRDWERAGYREPNPLADAVIRSKRAGKWRTAYAQPFLDGRDAGDRIHPQIRSLAARTARMSVSNPPLQQLPSSDWRVRRAIIADPGNVIVACDYSAVELRVLAAMAGVEEMKRLILDGADLHSATAELVYGDEFLNGGDDLRAVLRKRVKAVGLGKVYGGGAAGLSAQTGIPVDLIRQAISGYDRAYPEVSAYGKRLQRQAAYGRAEVVTPAGRHLPLDRDRAYAATNYMVQSTARDLMAAALLRLEAAGLGEHLLLPVHDEIVAQAPAAEAAEVAEAIRVSMTTELMGVPIDAEASVYGVSWGGGYAKGPKRAAYEFTLPA